MTTRSGGIGRVNQQGGQVILGIILFTLVGSVIVMFGIARPTLADKAAVRILTESKQSYSASESGIEDVLYRLLNGETVSDEELLEVAGSSATTTTTTVLNNKKVNAVGKNKSYIRSIKAELTPGEGAAFNYGMQSDVGGIILENSSSVRGNVYANGQVLGSGSNIVRGDVVSAGAGGLVDGIHSTSSVFANTIQDSQIEGDAYYQTIDVSTTVDGTKYPGSPDQPESELPIADSLIESWKSAAALGGVITSPCPYKIEDSASIGPVKIECDLEISNDPTITLLGPVWVEGSIDIKNTAHTKIDPSLGAQSVAVIADDPADRITGSKIEMRNSTTYEGSGSSGSYVLFVSQNNSAETAGSEVAIDVANSASGDLLIYAGHGEVLLHNNISLKEVTAYRIRLRNSAEVVYETGLASLLFNAGPGGGFSIVDWNEVE